MPRRDAKQPLDDDAEDRDRRLRRESEELAVDELTSYVSPDCPAEIEEEFWKQVASFEQAEWSKPFDVLVESGVELPPPAELNDDELTRKLWEVINCLGLLSVYLVSTDHLSDRELYEHLWHKSLREELVIQPNDPHCASFIDMIGSGSEEDNFIRLKYYADEEERTRWKTDWPEDPVPEHERPRYDRDSRLPQWRPTPESGDEVM
ncbi:MAG TPA: hypothetical protein VFV34_09600 [Blastocatellia bacterium]|nr:hypothetical protein [Blastocatellia bacterium]